MGGGEQTQDRRVRGTGATIASRLSTPRLLPLSRLVLLPAGRLPRPRPRHVPDRRTPPRARVSTNKSVRAAPPNNAPGLVLGAPSILPGAVSRVPAGTRESSVGGSRGPLQPIGWPQEPRAHASWEVRDGVLRWDFPPRHRRWMPSEESSKPEESISWCWLLWGSLSLPSLPSLTAAIPGPVLVLRQVWFATHHVGQVMKTLRSGRLDELHR